ISTPSLHDALPISDRGLKRVARLLRHFTGRNRGTERGDRRERGTIRHRRRLHLHLTPRPQTNVQGRGREGREILHHELLTPSASQTSGSGSSAPTHEVNGRSEEHTSELQSRFDLVCRLLLEKKKRQTSTRL